MVVEHWRSLHDAALVVDSACPLLVVPDYVDWYIEGGVDVVAPTVGGAFPASASLGVIGRWLSYIRGRGDLELVVSAAGARAAKAAQRTGVVFHLQGTDPIGESLDLVDVFKRLGVGIVQLTYNVENAVGYGAQVEDAGLKPFGVEFVRRCNEAGVVVDCSHTGHATSMAAVAASEAPVVLSHANARAVHRTETARNVEDELAIAVAESGGVVGVNGFPGFLVREGQPTLDDFLDHVDHFVSVAGVGHVGLGIDYYLGQHPVADPAEALRGYRREVEAGRWSGADYPPPPHRYPTGIETPRTLANLTRGLVGRGYSDGDVRAILGGNWLRVYDDVWGA